MIYLYYYWPLFKKTISPSVHFFCFLPNFFRCFLIFRTNLQFNKSFCYDWTKFVFLWTKSVFVWAKFANKLNEIRSLTLYKCDRFGSNIHTNMIETFFVVYYRCFRWPKSIFHYLFETKHSMELRAWYHTAWLFAA